MEKNPAEADQSSAAAAPAPAPATTTTTTNSLESNDTSRNEEKNEEEEKKEEEASVEADSGSNYQKQSEEIDQLIATILNVKDGNDPDANPPEIPIWVEKFVSTVQAQIAKLDCDKDLGKWPKDSSSPEDSLALIEAINRVSKLGNVVWKFASKDPKYTSLMNQTSIVVQQAMMFLEGEFLSLLDDSKGGNSGSVGDPKMKQMSFKSSNQDVEKIVASASSDSGSKEEANYRGFPPELVSRLCMMTNAMIGAGYGTECYQLLNIMRRNSFEQTLAKAGFEKVSIEDVQKMNWESLENEIATWIKVCKLCISSYLPGEKSLCEAVFTDHPSMSASSISNLARGAVIQFLNFAEAVAMSKRSAEKLFKFLDMYETLRDLVQCLENLFPGDSSPGLKCEADSTRCRIGEATVSIFSDLENSIKADSGKTPVPGGAVHPLTRYVMNYLKLACEYKDTLQQVFEEHKKVENTDELTELDNEGGTDNGEERRSPFSVQLLLIMDLLDSNLEAKSKLYKDLSLSNIFLMNNWRYIIQKFKGSPEIHDLFGDTWRRKRSSDLRQYHKNYQRETWSKVHACLSDEGLLQGKGTIVKPLLKERFKSFNAMFDEIHKTQSMWVVSDEQLQSELRVSIGAVVIPAYRSFLGRFQQYLDPGRQTEKYIKYGSEELEASIDELFDGTPASMVKRRA